MAEKKKTDIIKILIFTVFSVSAVIFIWMLKNSRFSEIPVILSVAGFVAFFAEVLLLVALKSKNIFIRIIKIILLISVNFSVFAAAVIYSFAPSIILQPHFDEISYSALVQTEQAEEITFEGSNGTVSGWFYERAGDEAPTVLYFYGNYENASTRLLQLINSSDDAFYNCNFAVFDYPAYGKSEGKCSDDTLLSFALEVFDKVNERTKDIIVLGYSVGTGPATYVASQRDCTALILYAPYSDGVDLYNNVFDIFHGPLKKLVSFNVESDEYAKSVTEKTLILASETDELIPFSSSERLSLNFSGECSFLKTPDIGHNEFLSSLFVKEQTEVFIKEVTAE